GCRPIADVHSTNWNHGIRSDCFETRTSAYPCCPVLTQRRELDERQKRGSGRVTRGDWRAVEAPELDTLYPLRRAGAARRTVAVLPFGTRPSSRYGGSCHGRRPIAWHCPDELG